MTLKEKFFLGYVCVATGAFSAFLTHQAIAYAVQRRGPGWYCYPRVVFVGSAKDEVG